MQRYFYIRDQEMTVALTIEDGSRASIAPVEVFREYFGSEDVHELSYEQYQEICVNDETEL